MKYKILLTDAAFRDLENIKEIISNDNLQVATKYVGGIFERLETLQDLPYLGIEFSNSFFDYAFLRYLICRNHIVIYQINEISKSIYILRVYLTFKNGKT